MTRTHSLPRDRKGVASTASAVNELISDMRCALCCDARHRCSRVGDLGEIGT
jgi:hypothetical protein